MSTQPPADATGTQAVIDAAVRTVAPTLLEVGNVYAFHTRDGVHQVDLTGDAYKATPTRKTGLTRVLDAASFTAYWTKHSDTDSEVYANADHLTVTAVLDAHAAPADGARWAQHRLQLGLQRTDAWKAWEVLDGKLLTQEQFAEHLEDRLPELLDPDAATMLEIAQSMQATSKVDFTSGVRLQSGERQFKYVEKTNTTAGARGDLTVPETFVVGLVPFEGSEGYKLTARLRYRIQDGGLRIGYRLERPGDVLRTAFADVVAAIAAAVDTTVLNGVPA